VVDASSIGPHDGRRFAGDERPLDPRQIGLATGEGAAALRDDLMFTTA
jgi:hypothetical protein